MVCFLCVLFFFWLSLVGMRTSASGPHSQPLLFPRTFRVSGLRSRAGGTWAQGRSRPVCPGSASLGRACALNEVVVAVAGGKATGSRWPRVQVRSEARAAAPGPGVPWKGPNAGEGRLRRG